VTKSENSATQRFTRHERKARAHRRVPEHALQVERAQEEGAEHAHREQGTNQHRTGDIARPEEAQGDERMAGARLDEDEGGNQHRGHAGHAERPRREPPIARRLEDGVHGERRCGGDEQGTPDVDPAAQACAGVRMNENGAEGERGHTDRHVDEEGSSANPPRR